MQIALCTDYVFLVIITIFSGMLASPVSNDDIEVQGDDLLHPVLQRSCGEAGVSAQVLQLQIHCFVYAVIMPV